MLSRSQSIGPYVVEDLIGEGGAAAVYRGRHVDLDACFALKVPTLQSHARDRLLREARVQAAVRHPNVVGVHDVLESSGTIALVLELVDGPSLERWARRVRPDPRDARALLTGICEGVAEAHASGVVHRDLKPSNVLLARTARGWIPRVTDFGIAAVGGGASAGGTASYMAPEQLRDGSAADPRADVFSLGCILYELLCGQRPFEGDLVEALNAAAAERYPPVHSLAPHAPGDLVALVRDCLAADPAARPHDAVAMLARLGAPDPVRAGLSRGDWDSDGLVASRARWMAQPLPGREPRPAFAATPVTAPPRSLDGGGHHALTLLDAPSAGIDPNAHTAPAPPERRGAPPGGVKRGGGIAALLLVVVVAVALAFGGLLRGDAPRPIGPFDAEPPAAD